MLEQLTRHLAACYDLTDAQIKGAVEQLVLESVPLAQKADFLCALTKKGETPDEIGAFVREMRARSIKPPIDPELRQQEILDVVGTGGDRLSTFNISTTVALLCAAAGVRVAKHGNRASTSPIGSADVIEALGLPLDLTPEQAALNLARHGFAFFFAPKYHPAFKHIVPARKLCAQRGQSTVFNYLGPLLNPASPSAMLVGVPRPELCEPLARVLQSLGVRRAMVVCGSVPAELGGPRYIDEFSPLGETALTEFYQERGMASSRFSLDNLPMQPATLADLRGGDREANASIIRRILDGQERGPKRDAVLLNAAAALFIAGKSRTMAEGWELAAQVIDTGGAWIKFEQLRTSTH